MILQLKSEGNNNIEMFLMIHKFLFIQDILELGDDKGHTHKWLKKIQVADWFYSISFLEGVIYIAIYLVR